MKMSAMFTSTTTTTSPVQWILSALMMVLMVLRTSAEDHAKEICHLETFNASCPHGSVIMMQTARYGRMRVGRCLSTSYFVGCYTDVLPYADAKCSGRRSCSIRVLDPELVQFQPCRKDLMAYLEASYTCIPVPDWSSEECVNSGSIDVKPDNGYLSFRAGHSIPAGTASCPWKVEVAAGQKVKFDVFSYLPMTKDGSTVIEINGAPCKHSLVLIDGEQKHEMSVCKTKSRIEHIYTSTRSSVQVYLKSDSPITHHSRASNVLLKYEAVGCPDIEGIMNAEIERIDATAVVKCLTSPETWHLVCRDNAWIGEIKNCTTQALEDPSVSKSGVPAATSMKYKFHYGVLIAVAIGLVLGVMIGTVLLMCMMAHRKRKRRRRSGDNEQSRQNTFLCDFTEDKTQYASFIPRKDLKYDVTLQKGNNDVTSHLTTLNFPNDFRLYACDSPDVVYSPRTPRGSYQNTTCEACRTCSQSVSTSHPSVYQSQEMFHPTYGPIGKYLSGDSQSDVMTCGKHPGDAQQPEVMNISGNYALYDTVSNLSSDRVVSV